MVAGPGFRQPLPPLGLGFICSEEAVGLDELSALPNFNTL